MRDRDLRDRSVALDDVDGAPVAHTRDRQFGDPGERVAVGKGRPEHVACLEEEAPLLLGALAIVDVGRSPDPRLDASALVADRRRPGEMPAVGSVAGAEAELVLEGLDSTELRQQVFAVRRMDGVVPGRSGGICGRHPGVVEPAPVEIRRVSVDVGAPHDLRHRVGELAVARLTRALEREQVLFVQTPVLLPQIDEDGDLRAQQVRIDRLEDVVDRADLVPVEHLVVVLGKRGDEDDRDVLGA